jgi:small ligand-binding sensory domain FIST
LALEEKKVLGPQRDAGRNGGARESYEAMRFASALSRAPDADDALAEASELVERDIEACGVELLFVFVSPAHAGAWDDLARKVQERFPRARIVGCSGAGIVGGAREAEGEPALSLTGGALPGTRLVPLVFAPGKAPYVHARSLDGLEPSQPASLFLFADPMVCDAGQLLRELDAARPFDVKVGGLASGPSGELALFLGGQRVHAAAVGVALQGPVRVDTLVSQGCRPIAEPMIVTRCEGNVIHELGGRRPIAVLKELFSKLTDPREQELAKTSLFLGLEVDASKLVHKEGQDLLVRHILGVERTTGALVVASRVERHQVVRLVVRDARAAEEDLRAQLRRHKAEGRPRPEGALLVSCVGRGAALFGAPHHDSKLVEEELGETPLGGFFSSGEIGPVGGRSFVHGYTTVVTTIAAAPDAADEHDVEGASALGVA